MNEAVQKPRYGVELPSARRFELADISRHVRWLLPRITKQYPHLNDRTALGFLNNLIYNADYYFVYQPNAAGLVQVERSHMLTPEPIAREKFVWCEDPKNPDHVEQAVEFYSEFAKWGGRLGAKIMVIEEASDVPHEKVREVFDKRIFTREQKFVRLVG